MAKGQKTGGRVAGTRNKTTRELKEIIDSVIEPKSLVIGLTKIAGDVEAPPAARVAAYKELLDRRYGKAPQAITGADGGPLAIVAAMGKATDEQLEELIAQMAAGLSDADV